MNPFTREDIDTLKDWAHSNILEVFAALDFYPTQNGRYLKSECPVPFHSGDADNANGFSWSLSANRWGCWTHGCHMETKWDIIGFIQAMKECSFGAALHWLNELKKTGVDKIIVKKSLNPITQYRFQRKLDKRKLSLLMPDFYFKARGIDEKLLTQHQVGYWQKDGTFMNKRSIVPIFDIDSNLVGYSGRALFTQDECDKLGISKWIHSIDFVSYSEESMDKSNVLYNLDKCKDIIRSTKTIFIVEGPIDCWRLQMAGIPNVVATLGLYMTMAQQNILLNLGVEKIILCLDNDKNGAGKKAAERLKVQLGSMFEVIIKLPEDDKDYGEMRLEHIRETLSVL